MHWWYIGNSDKFTDFQCVAFVCYLPPENPPWSRYALAFFAFAFKNLSQQWNKCNISDVDNIKSRDITDYTQNLHKQSFAEFLFDSKFCVLNMRYGEASNKFTSVSVKVKAVVNYVCVPRDQLGNCYNFRIKPCSDVIESVKLQNFHNPDVVFQVMISWCLATNAKLNTRRRMRKLT